MNRYIILITVMLSIVQSALATDKTTVGVIISLTGEAASIGAACRNGITLALEKSEIARERLNVRIEDDQNDPAKTVTAFKSLAQEPLQALITFSSGTSKAIVPLTEQQKIPLMAVASDPVISRNRTYAMNFWVSPREEAKVLFQEMQRRKYKHIARISAIQPAMLAMKEAFDDLSKGEIAIVLDEEYSTTEKDFRTFLTKLTAHKDIDAIFVNLYVGQTGLFAKQARTMGFAQPLLNIETFENPSDVSASQGALIGQEYVQADDTVSDFANSYKQRFPNDTPFTAGNCHDAILLLAGSMKSGRTINEYLHSVKNFSGAMGTFSAVGDGTFSLPAAMKRVTKDGFEKAEEH